jgi:hypothetical protein
MAAFHSHLSHLRRVIVGGGFAALVAVTPSVVAFADPDPTTDTLATTACPPGEQEDPFTLMCVPELVPANAIADPGRSEQDVEQDVYDTPGLAVPHVGGTTVP